ncbi:MAG: sulfatase [Anaerolineae bacterium]
MSQNQPNVLFVVVDDLRPQLNCYGVDWILSPNIDELAARGMVFERAYCQQAVCAPSRASVLSGCRPATTGIYDLQTPLRSVMPDVLTLPLHFKQNGHTTVSIGKVYHHAKDDLEAWSSEPFRSQGDWKGRGYLTDEAIEAIAQTDAEMAAQGSSRRGLGPAYEAAEVEDDGYHDGKDALAAIDALQDLVGEDQPFFLALGFHKPHLPFNAPKRYWDMYEPEALPLAPNPFEPEGVTEFSLTDFGELRGYFGIPKEGDIPDDLARNLIHGYAACVTYMDAQLGKVIDELDRLGVREDTIIILWGDHGWKLGEHASWCKHTNFEIDARAPMLISVPGKTSGERTAALVEFVDMYPTLCELCGLRVPEHCEGLSLVPLLDDPDRAWKSAAFSQYPRRGGEVMGTTMRTDRYRYTQWEDAASGEVLARELYDHAEDPHENVNAALNPAYAEVVEELEAKLRRGWQGALPEEE